MIGALLSSTKSKFHPRGMMVGGKLKPIGKIKVLTPQGDLTIWDTALAEGFALSIVPGHLSAAQASPSPTQVTTPLCEAFPDNATGEVTYAWAIEGDDTTWRITAPTGKATKFTALDVQPQEFRPATFRCTATDQIGRTVSETVTVIASNYGDSRGYEIQP